MPENITVSFCIPVYNNAKAAEKIVNCLLTSQEQNFEVIVSDDASTDNAKELLTEIHDKRFHYYRNEKNLGTQKNWEHSLELGRGQWLYLVIGRDKIRGENISNLIEKLNYARDNNITCVFDKPVRYNKTKIYSGINAMIRFIGWYHPTGIIFNGKIFHEIPDRIRYFETSDMYPENYVKRDMLLKGKGAWINSGAWCFESFENENRKSTVEYNKNPQDAFFAPKRRTNQFFEQFHMIEDLSDIFSIGERDKYFRAKFYDLIFSVSYSYRYWCIDPQQMAHYGQAVRHISRWEMFKNMLEAFRKVKTHLKENKIYSFKRLVMMYYCIVKAIVYQPVKNEARTLRSKLGI